MSRKTIDAGDLARQARRNSPKMPRVVSEDGRRMKWVGIGWVEVGDPTGHEPLVICDCNRAKEKP